jgi:hypothetical protein
MPDNDSAVPKGTFWVSRGKGGLTASPGAWQDLGCHRVASDFAGRQLSREVGALMVMSVSRAVGIFTGMGRRGQDRTRYFIH